MSTQNSDKIEMQDRSNYRCICGLVLWTFKVTKRTPVSCQVETWFGCPPDAGGCGTAIPEPDILEYVRYIQSHQDEERGRIDHA